MNEQASYLEMINKIGDNVNLDDLDDDEEDKDGMEIHSASTNFQREEFLILKNPGNTAGSPTNPRK